jgi:hypothetical protein
MSVAIAGTSLGRIVPWWPELTTTNWYRPFCTHFTDHFRPDRATDMTDTIDNGSGLPASSQHDRNAKYFKKQHAVLSQPQLFDRYVVHARRFDDQSFRFADTTDLPYATAVCFIQGDRD